jgi:hypothetical protein
MKTTRIFVPLLSAALCVAPMPGFSRSNHDGGRGGERGGSRNVTVPNRGSFVNRGSFSGNRGAFVGNRGAFVGNRGSFVNRGSFSGNRGSFIGNRGSWSSGRGSNRSWSGNRSWSHGDRSWDHGDRSWDHRDRWSHGHSWGRSHHRPYYRYAYGYPYSYGYYPYYSYGYPYYGYGSGFGVSFYSEPSYYDDYYYSSPVYRGRVVEDYADSLEVDVQRELRRRGFYRGAIDGDIGPATRAAIRAFQADRGLRVTGRIDASLLRSLGIG